MYRYCLLLPLGLEVAGLLLTMTTRALGTALLCTVPCGPLGTVQLALGNGTKTCSFQPSRGKEAGPFLGLGVLGLYNVED